MPSSQAARTSGSALVANAGADELTGPLCAPTLFRTSFSAWQPAYALGKVVADKGHKRVVTLTWKYSFGQQSIEGFKESFEKGGGKIVTPSPEFKKALAAAGQATWKLFYDTVPNAKEILESVKQYK